LRLEILALTLLLTVPLAAQQATSADVAKTVSPRQALQSAETLFSQGHRFTAEELESLKALHDDLVTSGDTDLAADLDLMKLGAIVQTTTNDDKAQAKVALGKDTLLWDQRQRQLREEGFWRTVRDVGLATFTISTVATLLLATVNDRNQALLQRGNFSDYDARNTFNNGMNWAMAGTASAAFISLFPLLWGEARQ